MQYVGNLVNSVTDFYKELNPSTLSGAIDIIVIKDSNNVLSCSPFHVRFGKLQLLRPHEKAVSVKVNGNPTNFVMKLGEAGEAFFVFESNTSVPSSYATSPVVLPEPENSLVEEESFQLPKNALENQTNPSTDLLLDKRGYALHDVKSLKINKNNKLLNSLNSESIKYKEHYLKSSDEAYYSDDELYTTENDLETKYNKVSALSKKASLHLKEPKRNSTITNKKNIEAKALDVFLTPPATIKDRKHNRTREEEIDLTKTNIELSQFEYSAKKDFEQMFNENKLSFVDYIESDNVQNIYVRINN